MCRGRCNFRFESDTEKYENLTKRGRSVTNFYLEEIPLGRVLPPKKIENIQSLLKAEFNDDWDADPDLAWFKNLIGKHINEPITTGQQNDAENHVSECDCLTEETPALHI